MNIEDLEIMIEGKIAEHGVTFIGVFDPSGENPPFAYSVGLSRRGWPELLMIGDIPPQYLEQIMTAVYKRWVDIDAPVMGEMTHVATLIDGSDCPMRLMEVDPQHAIENYACQVPRFSESDTHRVVQVLWPDKAGLYPNDISYNASMMQPLLPVVSRTPLH